MHLPCTADFYNISLVLVLTYWKYNLTIHCHDIYLIIWYFLPSEVGLFLSIDLSLILGHLLWHAFRISWCHIFCRSRIHSLFSAECLFLAFFHSAFLSSPVVYKSNPALHIFRGLSFLFSCLFIIIQVAIFCESDLCLIGISVSPPLPQLPCQNLSSLIKWWCSRLKSMACCSCC